MTTTLSNGSTTEVPTLRVENLSIAYRTRGRNTPVVDSVSFDVHRGQTLAIVGESGSGKSTIANAIVGSSTESARITGGRIMFGDDDILTLKERALRRLRGSEIAFIPQDPGSSLDPIVRVGAQIAEVFTTHRRLFPVADVDDAVTTVLQEVGFDNPDVIRKRYPHELSGGMRQRILIAMAVALSPRLLIADEPTSALDVTVQRTILDLLSRLGEQHNMAVVLITHDIGVAVDRSNRVLVLDKGAVVEEGESATVLRTPTHPYTQRLVSDVPTLADARLGSARTPRERLLSVSATELRVEYASGEEHPVVAVDDISFEIATGETLAVVGESGSGKTTTARTLARFVTATSGNIDVRASDGTSLSTADERDFRRHVQFVYQNPRSSLSPRRSIGSIIAEPLDAFHIGNRRSRTTRRNELLELVGLPTSLHTRTPRELSGGQQQRVAIARALALSPSILVLDEPVSALDVTVQAQILDLLVGLQDELALTYLFISHDLAVVKRVADTVLVMKSGRVVEYGRAEAIFGNPQQDYTLELLGAVPGSRTLRPTGVSS